MTKPLQSPCDGDGSSGRRGAWTRYWASGAAHSCIGSFADDYAGAIGDFWREVFATLAPAQRVLDIGTGNGPLPRMLVERELAVSALPRVDAVDLAEPSPEWLSTLDDGRRACLAFHAGVAAENLPFQDATFDLVTSQYGIEYADLPRALAEALRVLKPSGRMAFVCHHTGSVIHEVATEESGHLQWLLGTSTLFELAADLLPAMARLATPGGRAAVQADPEANAARARLNRALQALGERVRQSRYPDVLDETAQALLGLLGQAGSVAPERSVTQLEGLRESMHDARLRSAELCAHALDAAAVALLIKQMNACGRHAEADEIRDQGRLLGWGIRVGATRAAA